MKSSQRPQLRRIPTPSPVTGIGRVIQNFDHKFTVRRLTTCLCTALMLAVCLPSRALAQLVANGETASTTMGRDAVEVTELQPFTHVAYLPAGSDLSSIKIKSIKAVKVATKQRSISNQQSCDQPWSEPGGCMYPQRTRDLSSEPAYRVTYSYRGQPMASDEYNNPYFTFSVYFRPTEASPKLRDMLSLGKIRRATVAELLEITTFTDSVQQVVIDEANSTFCHGNYVDGNWIHTNPKCEDRIAYKKVASPSPYIAVRVDPVLAGSGLN